MPHTEKEAKALLKALYATHFCDSTSDQVEQSLSQAVFASAPGRVELAGNHTDHQGGHTISAAVDKRAFALAIPNGTDEINVYMDGFGEATIQLCDLDPHADERGASVSLIRGMAALYAGSGKTLRGFNMVTCSDIPVGCGVSSSAAFEVLVGAVIHALCDPTAQTAPRDLTALALEGVQAEHAYFGKPCGAQDQLASAYGGIVFMDFSNDIPRVTPIDFDPDTCPYALYLIDSLCDHSHFIDEFAAIPSDMHAVAQYFGCGRLEDVPYTLFLEKFSFVRDQKGDRAALRALHYFEETRRVATQAEALRAGDFEAFIENVRLSGASSAQFLQNVSPPGEGSGASQPAMVILALCEHLLDGNSRAGDLRSAYRIHGGGFGGSVLAFVPSQISGVFQSSMDTLLGYNACMPVSIGARGVHVERLG